MDTGVAPRKRPGDNQVLLVNPSTASPVKAAQDIPRTDVGGAWALRSAVIAAFSLRMAAVLFLKAYLFLPRYSSPDSPRWNWEFGYEMGRVARSIAMGHGFGSPFDAWTGPTAWQPPVYPYLLAGIFKVFGVYSPASGVVALTINCVAAAITCLLIYRIADKVAGPRVAMWSAWMWAVSPWFMECAVRWAWETSLSAMLLTLALWWTLQLPSQHDRKPWLRLGALWGVIALTNPSLLSIMPFTLAWAWWQNPERRRVAQLAATLAMMLAVALPWIVRDHTVFGRWMFIRDNFWAELSYGNDEAARGVWMAWKHPVTQPAEMKRYVALGEIDYMAAKKEEVLNFVRRNPQHFAKLTLIHAILFWTDTFDDISDDLQPDLVLYYHAHRICLAALAFAGLVLLLRRRAGWLLAPALIIYPCLYFITSPAARYRHPIEPVMVILAVYAVATAWRAASVSGPPMSRA